MHEIIKKLVNNDIEVTIVKKFFPDIESIKEDDYDYAYRIEGFGKSGYLYLIEYNNNLFSISRYGVIDPIGCFDDILWLAKDWNKKGLEHGFGISSIWMPFFKEKGWIKREITNTFKE